MNTFSAFFSRHAPGANYLPDTNKGIRGPPAAGGQPAVSLSSLSVGRSSSPSSAMAAVIRQSITAASSPSGYASANHRPPSASDPIRYGYPPSSQPQYSAVQRDQAAVLVRNSVSFFTLPPTVLFVERSSTIECTFQSPPPPKAEIIYSYT
jgi:hypothetical protein